MQSFRTLSGFILEMSSKQEKVRQTIAHTFIENQSASFSSIAKHLKLHKSLVCRVLKKYVQTLSIKVAPGRGRKTGPADKKIAQKVLKSLKQNPGLSDGDRAKIFGTSSSYIRKLRLKYGYMSYHAIKHPNRSDKQNFEAIKRARKLYVNVLTKSEKCVLMDDETYVKRDFRQLPGKKFYVSTIRGNVSSKFKFVCQDKFAKKFMIWQALCTCGIKSRVFVTSSTMTAEICKNECLQKRILPIIRSHKSHVYFWPDLASCHYAGSTMEWYRVNKVDVIANDMNPPNCPALRPIEKYWAIVKRILKKNGGATNTVEQMRNKWNLHARKVTVEGVRKLMGSINTQVRKFLRQKD